MTEQTKAIERALDAMARHIDEQRSDDEDAPVCIHVRQAYDILNSAAKSQNPAIKGARFRKGQTVRIARALDFRSTGGPRIPKGTPATIEIVRRTGELWVDIEGFGRRHLYPKDMTVSP